MIILSTVLIGMLLFQLLITIEWVCQTYVSALDAFSQPLYRFERDWQDYMRPPYSSQESASRR